MANLVYDNAKVGLGNGTINWLTSDIRILLTKGSGYSPTPGDSSVASIVPASNEATGTNYARKSLASKAISRDDVNGRALYQAANLVWSAAGFSATTGAIVYLFNASDASALLLVHFDFFSTPNGADLTLEWSTNPAAVFTLT